MPQHHYLSRVCFFIVMCCLHAPLTQGQNRQIDSLKILLQASKKDTNRVNILNQICRTYWRISPDTSRKIANQSLALAKKLNFNAGIAAAENGIGASYYFEANYEQAVVHYKKALAMHISMKNELGMSKVYNNIGVIYKVRGDLLSALEYYQKSLKVQEKLKNIRMMSLSYNNMGNIYMAMENYEKALTYLQKAVTLKKGFKDASSRTSLVNAYNNIGRLYSQLKDYPKSRDYYQKSLAISVSENLHQSKALAYHHLGNLFALQSKLDSGAYYLRKALDISIKAGVKHIQNMSLNSLSAIYYQQKKYQKAIALSKEALALGKQTKELLIVKDASETLYKSYSALKNYKAAFIHQSQYIQIKDSLFSESRAKEMTRLELNYAFDKKQVLLKAEQKAKATQVKIENGKKLAQERLYLFSALGILATVLIISVFILRSRQTQKRLNGQLTEQKDELQAQKNELSSLNGELQQNQHEIIAQRDYIKKQNKGLNEQKGRIESSIKAARTIQQGMLPFDWRMEQIFEEHFVIYHPKDIVSGDFYWVSKVEEQTIVVVADCTGHGVPGAFMSLVGMNLLDKIVFQEGITSPALILDRLHLLMNQALHQQALEKRNGGMDAVVFSLTKQIDKSVQLVFSGARNPLYYRTPDAPVIQMLKGDRMSIGGRQSDTKRFTSKVLVLAQNSLVYAGSDGFQDQNNAKRKKIGGERLLNLLDEITPLALSAQQKAMEDTLTAHMKGTTQRDDILWLGIKV